MHQGLTENRVKKAGSKNLEWLVLLGPPYWGSLFSWVPFSLHETGNSVWVVGMLNTITVDGLCFCSDVVSWKPPFKLNIFQWFEQKTCEEWWNEGNTPCSYSWNLAIGSVSFSKNVFFLGLEVISTKTNKGSLASHQLRYNCLPIKVISSWLEFYFIWNHFPLLLLDPAVLYIIYIFYKPQVEQETKIRCGVLLNFICFPP